MTARMTSTVVGLCLFMSLAAPYPASSTTSEPSAHSLLISHLQNGEIARAREVITSDRLSVRAAIDSLLLARASDILESKHNSAEAKLRLARDATDLYAAEFEDSFYQMVVAFHRELTPELVTIEASAWARYGEARQLYEDSKWHLARKASGDVLRLSGETRDRYLQERARLLSAECCYKTGTYEDGRAEAEEARRLAQRLGDGAGEVEAHRLTAVSYLAQQRNREAGRILEEVIDRARAVEHWKIYAEASNEIGIYYARQGNLSQAHRQFNEALQVSQRKGLLRLEGKILTNLGILFWQFGEPDSAMACEERGLMIARKAGNRRQEITALLKMAMIHSAMEEHPQALSLLREALPVAEETGCVEAAAEIRNEIGIAYNALERPEEALLYFQDAVPTLREMGKTRSLWVALHGIGVAQAKQDSMDKSLEALEEAAEVMEGFGSKVDLAYALADLGMIHSLRGDLDSAERYLQRSLSLVDTLENHMALAVVEFRLGLALSEHGDRDRAIPLLNRVIDRSRELNAPYILWQALETKGHCLWKEGRLEEAEELLTESMEVVESIRGRMAGDAFRLEFLAGKKTIYASRVGVLYDTGIQEGAESPALLEAFHVAERARARALLDVLSGTRLDPGENVEPTLREEERRLRVRIGNLQTSLSRAVSAEKWNEALIDSLESSLNEASREYRATLEEIASRSPSYGAITGQHDPLNVEQIRKRVLLPDQVLLEYLLGDEESYLFLVSGERYLVHRLPVGIDSLEVRVTEFRDAILFDGMTSGTNSATELAKELYALLLGPVTEELSQDVRLLIVPDGSLFYLPFAALHDGNKFLIEQHALTYAPSASVLDPAIRKAVSGRRGYSLLAVGNPSSFRSTQLLAAGRSVDDWSFGELPYAEEEVRRVAQYFSRAQALTRDKATEEAVKAKMAGVSHVHFATHGLLHEKDPLMSGLVLAQDEDPTEDGLLQVHEILGLELPADLVVLSACNTGLGRIAGGEGVLGLTRAFMYAGARAVVISLWEVADRSTADLMDTFYEASIGEGLPGDIALQKAQIAALSTGATPREWAPFVLTGSAELSRLAAGNEARRLTFLLAALVVLLGIAVFLLRSRRHARD